MSKNTNNETNTTPEVNLENTKETAEQILNEAREEAAKIIADIKDSNGNACLFNGLIILERARFCYLEG